VEQYPEDFHDELEAYPLRLHVAALPDRRFFKMTRTLTVGTVLLSALLIVLGVFLNYQLTHLNVTVRRSGVWQFYRIDPEEKRLKATESASVQLLPMRLVIEERLREYIKIRNSTVWNLDKMDENRSADGVIGQMSKSDIFESFGPEFMAMQAQTRGSKLVRDVHIYDVKLVNTNLWMALIETFDLPITDDLESVCACSDNSRSCLDCKIQNAQKRERRRIWIRTSFNRPQECRVQKRNMTCPNPLGISVDKYISTFVPIHDEATFWDLPAALRPDI